jgi:hypothetical protein
MGAGKGGLRLKLPPRHKQAFQRLGLHAIYAVGPDHKVHVMTDRQRILLDAVEASGWGDLKSSDLVSSYWPVRWGMSGNLSESLVTQGNGWSPAWDVQLLARVWFSSRLAALSAYEALQASTMKMKLSWADEGEPIVREWLELKVKGIAREAGINFACDDYEMTCVLDDAVFRRYRKDTRGTHAA